MKIPLLEFRDSNKIENDTWQEILVLASGELSSTDGLIDALKKRQRIALYKYKGEIVGIAALDILAEEFNGRKVCSIYTGNTWIRQDWRNKNLIQILAFVAMIQAKARYPFHSLFWFFGSNNYMSYRLLYNNFDNYWPNIEKETPKWELDYMRHLGVGFFDSTINLDTLVWSQESSRSFKEGDTKLTNKQMNDPYIKYYIKSNPGYVYGDRLMCMAPLDKNTIPHIVKLSVRRLWKGMNKNK